MKMNKIIAIILSICGVGMLGTGVYFNFSEEYNANNKNSGTTEEKENNKNEENIKDDDEDKEEVQDSETLKTRFDNYRMEATSTVVVYGFETTSYIEGVVDEKHQKEYLKTTTSTMGMDIVIETYTDFNTGYTYTSVPFTSDWEASKGTTEFVDLANMMEKFENNGDVTKVSENEYKIKLSPSDVEGLISSADGATSGDVTGDIYVNAFVNDGYITKLEYDFSGMISEIEKFTMVIEFSDFNNAGDVEIPSEVMN